MKPTTRAWILSAAAVSLLIASPGAALAGLAQSAWPCFGHDAQHTGRSEFAGPSNPRVLWKYKSKNRLVSTPSVAPLEAGQTLGDVYLGHSHYPLCRIDANDGSQLWCTTDNTGTFADRSSPAVGDDGSVYIGGRDNDLWWARATDGHVFDTFHIHTDGDVSTSPMIATTAGHDLILMGSNSLSAGFFYGMRQAPGPLLADQWLNVLGGGLANVSPALSQDGQVVYVSSAGKNLHAIDVNTGVELWRIKLEKKGNGVRAPNFTPVVGADGTIYVGFDKGLFAVTPDGNQKWLFSTDRRKMYSPPALGADGTIFFGAARRNDGMIFAVKDDGTQAAQLWSFPVKGRLINTQPIVDVNGVVYAVANRTLRAFDPAGNGQGGGKVIWERTFPRRVFDAGPILGGPGRIYVGSRDKFLYALGD
ncbi:MAG TPA: PQQ-binding-like beta-propeller repeat protein [Candidatus Binatia bacterium]|nr:PQQ-binding-like beta-propeller repeat protein [Candidatus Binatia bacterium]